MPPPGFSSCEDYWEYVKDDMQSISLKLTYGWLGVIAATTIGNMLVIKSIEFFLDLSLFEETKYDTFETGLFADLLWIW